MSESYEHLPISRIEPVTVRRPRRGFGSRRTVPSPEAHGERLLAEIGAVQRSQVGMAGFDGRVLIKIRVAADLNIDELRQIPGVEIISQEEKSIILAFASADGMAFFEQRLATMASGGEASRSQLLYALEAFDQWTPTDRTGRALELEGFPATHDAAVDIELWPHDDVRRRDASVEAFQAWLSALGIKVLGRVTQPTLILFRVSVNTGQLEEALNHLDVRTVDLPPRYALERGLLTLDIQTVAPIVPPADDAPSITILDTGLTTNHPLIAPAVGDAQVFTTNATDYTDRHGHGTAVAGIALYGDVAACVSAGAFVPEIRIFSGKLLDDDAGYADALIEVDIRDAVDYFRANYGCMIFNLSLGDMRKPFLGRRIGPLAVVIDNLAREAGVLFVISIGNMSIDQVAASGMGYPRHLLTDAAALLDPATAINALTVGAIAHYELSLMAQRFPEDPAYRPVARRDQPAPFTRHGLSVNDIIKPDLVSYGGNWAIDARAQNSNVERGLGEASTAHDFVTGRVLRDFTGTSFAAPYVSHLAARVSLQLRGRTANLVRATLIAHAKPPPPALALFGTSNDARKEAQRILGYGAVDEYALFRSTEDAVTMIAEEEIGNDRHHFYELPMPESFLTGRRLREISVALCYTPPVRSTRLDYKTTNISFRLVSADDLDYVVRMFNAATGVDDYDRIPELNGASFSATARSKGSNQSATWSFRGTRRGRYFVVVTRHDPPWGAALNQDQERYALVVCLRDRENAEARLYSEVQVLLRQQLRERIRI